jgi:hypothetical protein
VRFDRVMKLLAEDHGFIYAPAKRFKKGDDALGDPARSRPTRLSREQSRKIGQELREQFEEAQSWEDVEAAAALQGYRLQARGQGLALMGERAYARFSDLGSFARMKELERRFAELFTNYRRRPMQLVDGIDIVKALVGLGLGQRKDIAEAVNDAVRQREERPLPLRTQIAKAIKQVLGTAHRAAKRQCHDEELGR